MIVAVALSVAQNSVIHSYFPIETFPTDKAGNCAFMRLACFRFIKFGFYICITPYFTFDDGNVFKIKKKGRALNECQHF